MINIYEESQIQLDRVKLIHLFWLSTERVFQAILTEAGYLNPLSNEAEQLMFGLSVSEGPRKGAKCTS